MKKENKSELEILQDARDNANTPEELEKAKKAINVYFFGEPKKGKRKNKKRIKKRKFIKDEYDEYDDFEEYGI